MNKLSAAAASFSGCAFTSAVFAEPDDADFFLRLTVRLCFFMFTLLSYMSLRGTKQSQTLQNRYLSFGIAALSLTFFWPSKESKQRKLSAAPASFSVCAFTSVVVAEPDDADFFCG